jgi:hypothetical protein
MDERRLKKLCISYFPVTIIFRFARQPSLLLPQSEIDSACQAPVFKWREWQNIWRKQPSQNRIVYPITVAGIPIWRKLLKIRAGD